MVQGKMNAIKYLMFFFNLLFWIGGLVLMCIGGVIHSQYDDYFSYLDSKFTKAALLAVIVGAAVFVVGLFGCWGAYRENHRMLTVYASLLSIIYILEIIPIILWIIHKDDAERAVQVALKKAVDGYGVVEGDKKLLDWAQKSFKCCGYKGPGDFNTTATCREKQGVESCHKGGTCNGDLYNVGCEKEFILFLQQKMATIGEAALVVAACSLGTITINLFCCFYVFE